MGGGGVLFVVRHVEWGSKAELQSVPRTARRALSFTTHGHAANHPHD